MSLITLSVLEGFERGRVFAGLPTPVSIGREIDNTIQLNDDRVSRFHAKVQEDGGRVILTDLDSTNGTRVNGHSVQIRVLQQGDLVTIGRCVLRYGALPAPAAQEASPKDEPPTAMLNSLAPPPSSEELDFLAPPPGSIEGLERLFPQGAPDLPDGLRPLHRAQLSDMLAYFHSQLGRVLEQSVESVTPDGNREARTAWPAWQELIGIQMILTAYMKELAEPREPHQALPPDRSENA